MKKLTLNETEKNILIKALQRELGHDSLTMGERGTAEILLFALKKI